MCWNINHRKNKKEQDSYGLQRWGRTIAIRCRRHPCWLVYSTSTCVQHSVSTPHQSPLALKWAKYWFSDFRACTSPDCLVSHAEQEQDVCTTKTTVIIEKASDLYVCANVCCDCSYVSTAVSFDKTASSQTCSLALKKLQDFPAVPSRYGNIWLRLSAPTTTDTTIETSTNRQEVFKFFVVR